MSGSSSAAETITVRGHRKVDPNELRVIVNGVVYGGWQDVRVTRGVERMPSDFDIALTDRYPTHPAKVKLRPGQTCVVKIGDDVVLTGRIDRYASSLTPAGHQIRITGRGRCRELVDCAAGFNRRGPTGGQIGNALAVDICALLAAPFDITVKDLASDPGYISTQFNIIFGETVFEIIDRVARYSSRIAYEGTDGNLILSQVGTTQAASGFVEGVNIQSASVDFSMNERFSIYYSTMIGTNTLSDFGDAGFIVGKAVDGGVANFRPTVIVSSEMQQSGEALAAARAAWEMARRYGRSQAVTVTCDSWRDSAGTLWAPNTLAKVTIPAFALDANWIISEVSFNRGEGGTTATLILMPPQAFQPEPVILHGFDWQVDQALNGAADLDA